MTCPPVQDQGSSAPRGPVSHPSGSVAPTSNSEQLSEHQVPSNSKYPEYLIPRLFIILPEATTETWCQSNRISRQQNRTQARRFRLHFLCESGVHKVQEGSESLLKRERSAQDPFNRSSWIPNHASVKVLAGVWNLHFGHDPCSCHGAAHTSSSTL